MTEAQSKEINMPEQWETPTAKGVVESISVTGKGVPCRVRDDAREPWLTAELIAVLENSDDGHNFCASRTVDGWTGVGYYRYCMVQLGSLVTHAANRKPTMTLRQAFDAAMKWKRAAADLPESMIPDEVGEAAGTATEVMAEHMLTWLDPTQITDQGLWDAGWRQSNTNGCWMKGNFTVRVVLKQYLLTIGDVATIHIRTMGQLRALTYLLGGNNDITT